VRFRYVEARIRATERASGAPVIYTGGATGEILATLSAGTSVVALCDVPVPPGRSALEAPAMGRTLHLPAGLARLACRERIPVVVFHGGVDAAGGRRRIVVEAPTVFDDPQTMAEHLAGVLVSLLRDDAPAWHMWPHAGSLLR
jgi:lauroyl/myristoyl acyltransferase